MNRSARVSARVVKIAAIIILFFGLSVGIVRSNVAGPVPGVAGVPAGGGFPKELNCSQSQCHETSEVNPDKNGKVQITGLPDNYIPGKRYSLVFGITSTDTDRLAWGFQATVIARDTFLGVGKIVITDTNNTQEVDDGNPMPGREYIEQTTAGTAVGRRGGMNWRFDWQAPASNEGDVAFYGSGNAADGDVTYDGDKIYNPSPDPVAASKGQYNFSDVATAAGVATSGSLQGSATADYNKDGAVDIFLIRAGQALLYKNNGNGTFSDVTSASGLTGTGISAAAWGDFDGDGSPDIYLVNSGADLLWKNNGSGTFTDVSTKAGISDSAVGHGCAWGDFNGDNKADLYVANEGQDILYLNKGDGTFTKVDPAAGGLRETAAGWSVTLADFDGDGKLDIFVANDGQDFLYKNNGNGSFTEGAVAAGIATADAKGRAVAWADYDKDGKPDLLIANTGQDLLFKNNGGGKFTDVTKTAGLADSAVASGAAWADYDNDGDQDFFVANVGQDLLYRNNGNDTFNSVAPFSGMTDKAAGSGANWLDFDKDGKIDLLVTNTDTGNFLYKNPGKSAGSMTSSRLARAVQTMPWRAGSVGIILFGVALVASRTRRKRA